MAEQPDKISVIKLLANMLQRLAKLYQIPNWDETNSVELATWIYDNYKYDSLDDVIACLANPPATYDERGVKDSNWRLTPDRVERWMAVQLEKTSIKRENEHREQKEKEKEPLQVVDYNAFKKRIETQGLPKKERGFQDPDYKQFRADYREKLIMKQKEKQYIEKFTDLQTGKIIPGSPSLDEFIRMDKI